MKPEKRPRIISLIPKELVIDYGQDRLEVYIHKLCEGLLTQVSVGFNYRYWECIPITDQDAVLVSIESAERVDGKTMHKIFDKIRIELKNPSLLHDKQTMLGKCYSINVLVTSKLALVYNQSKLERAIRKLSKDVLKQAKIDFDDDETALLIEISTMEHVDKETAEQLDNKIIKTIREWFDRVGDIK